MLARAPFNLKQGSETVESYFNGRIFVLYQSIPFYRLGSRGKSVAKEEVALAVRAIHLFEVTVPAWRRRMESYDHPRLIGFWKGGIVDVRERKVHALGENRKTQNPPLANRRNIRCTKGPAKDS